MNTEVTLITNSHQVWEWKKHWPDMQFKKNRVQEGVSAFKRYANNLTLVNRHFQGEQGLSMKDHQKSRLLEFLRNNRNMKLNIRAEGLFNRPETDEDEEEPEEREVLYKLPSTRFNVHNEDDSKQAIGIYIYIYTLLFKMCIMYKRSLPLGTLQALKPPARCSSWSPQWIPSSKPT